MNHAEKKLEILALSESFKAGAIDRTQYSEGVYLIVNSPEFEKFSATKNLGIDINEVKKVITIGQCKLKYDDGLSKSRQLRVATFLKDNPTEEKAQRPFN